MAGMIGGFHNTRLMPRLVFQANGVSHGAPVTHSPAGEPSAPGPEIMVKENLDPTRIIGFTPVGSITPWGDETTTHMVAMGNPLGYARLAVHAGVLKYSAGKFHEFHLEDGPKPGEKVVVLDAEVDPKDVLARFEDLLVEKAGPRWLEARPSEAGAPPNEKRWWGGAVPDGLRSDRLMQVMGIDSSAALKGTALEKGGDLMTRANENGVFLDFAVARAQLLGRILLEKLSGDRTHAVGSSVAEGIEGLNAVIGLVDSALAGKDRTRDLMALPNMLAQGAGGAKNNGMGPTGDEELPEIIDPEVGLRTWGPNFAGSAECAGFFYQWMVAVNAVGSRIMGQWSRRLMEVSAAEAAFGIPSARPGNVGFNTMKATELLVTLKARGAHGKKLWGKYPPFLRHKGLPEGKNSSFGFWMGEGAAATYSGTVDFLFRQHVPFKVLGGLAVFGDQAGKINVARLGRGIINAGLEAFNMARAAGIPPRSLRYASFHGTGTSETNLLEPRFLIAILKALNALPPAERKVKVTSLKAFLTHLLGAAGGAELAIIDRGLELGALPGLFNVTEDYEVAIAAEFLEYLDASADPLIWDPEKTQEIMSVLMFSEGFWGCNAAAIVAAATEELLKSYGYVDADISEHKAAIKAIRKEADRFDWDLLAGVKPYREILARGAFA